MGILYNRYNNDLAIQSLIPYSVQSDILTYLVPSSFKGSSSTLWGDDYPIPMVRQTVRPSDWQYSSDDSVYLQGDYTITPGDWGIANLSKFTVYLVLKYTIIREPINAPALALVQNMNTPTIDYVYEQYGVQVRARLRTSNDTYTSVLTPASSTYDNYHVYAFRRSVGNFCHVVDDQNLVSISASGYLGTTIRNLFLYNLDNTDTFECYGNLKFLSVVNGEESDSTILNNVRNIRTALNLP